MFLKFIFENTLEAEIYFLFKTQDELKLFVVTSTTKKIQLYNSCSIR